MATIDWTAELELVFLVESKTREDGKSVLSKINLSQKSE